MPITSKLPPPALPLENLLKGSIFSRALKGLGRHRQLFQSKKKLEIELPCAPEIPLLGIHTEETRIETDMYTPMFIAALFIIARTWKQPRCPSADKWIRKLWYIYTMEYYSVIKNKTFESVLMRWMKLEPIIQSEISQNKKH